LTGAYGRPPPSWQYRKGLRPASVVSMSLLAWAADQTAGSHGLRERAR
jgi:hypothetical protein